MYEELCLYQKAAGKTKLGPAQNKKVEIYNSTFFSVSAAALSRHEQNIDTKRGEN